MSLTTLTKVTSSNIEAIGHDPVAKTLVVEFKNGSRYSYQNVEQALFEAIRDADSVGATFNKMVKAHPAAFPFTKEN